MKNKLYLAGSICLYVLTFILITIAALFFAMSNKLYWLFVILGLCALLGGFILNYYREKNSELKEASENPTVEKKKKPFYLKTSFITMCASLLLTLVGGFIGQLGETSFYTVKVSDFTLTKEMTERNNNGMLNGKKYVIATEESTYGVTMYVPNNAITRYNKDNNKKAPTVFVIPGFTRTKSTMAQYGIEFSRRGAVVFVIDPGCQGATTAGGYTYSENNVDEDGVIVPEMVSSTAGANGAEYLIQYVYNNTEDFPWVDRDRIGVVGHSAGGGNAIAVASDLAGTDFNSSIIKAVYNSGYIKTSAANKFTNLHCNAAMSYAYYDEGAYRYQTSTTAFEAISLRFINEVSGDKKNIDRFTLDTIVDVEYGDISQGTYRVVHHEKTNHCFEMYDKLSIKNTTDFFAKTLGTNSLDGGSQIWFLKESGTLLSLVSGFVFFIALAMVLLDLPFFKWAVSNKVEAPVRTVRKIKTPLDKFIFWGAMILTAIIACLDYIPLAYLSTVWFPDAASNTYTFYFPARMVNAILLWAAINGLIGLVLFFGINLGENGIRWIIHKTTGKEVEYTLWKLKPLWIEENSKAGALKALRGAGVTLLTAAIIFGAFYGLVYLDYAIFHSDFRFMLISASRIPARYWVVWLEYFPIIFIFYISNSIRVNCSIGFEGFKEWQVKLIGALANSLGLVFILVINYYCYFKTGIVYYGYRGDGTEVWLYINMVFGLIPMMFILPIINRIFYNKTNKPYLGAIVCCAIFIMMTLTASVAYIPL